MFDSGREREALDLSTSKSRLRCIVTDSAWTKENSGVMISKKIKIS